MLVVLLFTFLPAFLFLLSVYLWTNIKKSSSKRKRKRRRYQQNNPYTFQLQQKFLAMLGGNKATAQRLIEHERERNPEKSEDWYLEKAIYRLERDRNV